MLPSQFYSSKEAFDADLEHIWFRSWLFAGFENQVKEPGEYFTYQVGSQNVIVIRGDDGRLRAFHNVCRHRGARICNKERGKSANLTCPYHSWTYNKLGECVKASNIDGQFALSDKSLISAHVRCVDGLVFISFGDNPPDFDPAEKLIHPQIKLHRLRDTKIAFITNDIVNANWKIVYENNRECYHCAGTHPEYIRSNYDLSFSYQWLEGATKASRITDPKAPKFEEAVEHTKYCQDLWEKKYGLSCTVDNDFPGDGWYRATRAPLRKGWVNESLDGQPVAPILGDFQDRDLGTLRIHLLPNFWIHVSSDYACSTRLTPIDELTTHAQAIWLVHKDAQEGKDYSIDKLIPFWKKTNDADWRICEANQAGVLSPKYQPSEFVKAKESGIENFLSWYITTLKNGIDQHKS